MLNNQKMHPRFTDSASDIMIIYPYGWVFILAVLELLSGIKSIYIVMYGSIFLSLILLMSIFAIFKSNQNKGFFTLIVFTTLTLDDYIKLPIRLSYMLPGTLGFIFILIFFAHWNYESKDALKQVSYRKLSFFSVLYGSFWTIHHFTSIILFPLVVFLIFYILILKENERRRVIMYFFGLMLLVLLASLTFLYKYMLVLIKGGSLTIDIIGNPVWIPISIFDWFEKSSYLLYGLPFIIILVIGTLLVFTNKKFDQILPLIFILTIFTFRIFTYYIYRSNTLFYRLGIFFSLSIGIFIAKTTTYPELILDLKKYSKRIQKIDLSSIFIIVLLLSNLLNPLFSKSLDENRYDTFASFISEHPSVYKESDIEIVLSVDIENCVFIDFYNVTPIQALFENLLLAKWEGTNYSYYRIEKEVTIKRILFFVESNKTNYIFFSSVMDFDLKQELFISLQIYGFSIYKIIGESIILIK
ncbi:MAG: hypothetical protein K9W45_03570 [Candidatus Heimdallarchaeum aukensis]|uniref:Uncharacterized protein n=1 Tax=Candidatus Heimdallarchaeum aukensis TaxID=2876573 RepID=A0A9Y1BM26_9ARCH|nr:MAG: hypothetical protein K9W45_03570 [Candidatus Heimdallarchaeum aukensis]